MATATADITALTQAAERWRDCETVPLVDVARAAGIPRSNLIHIENRRLVHPVRPGSRGQRLELPNDEVMLFLAAAALALVAGLAIATALRTVRATGATLTPDGFSLPITGT